MTEKGERKLKIDLKITNEPVETAQDGKHKYSSKGLAVHEEMAVYSCKLS